ncbi:AMP-binding protein [Streptomyces rubiginosohelvolus]|uniref:AMP-binding protein n=1 Tax=Streptomyces rubiginosohelvolus TaxID=67362 RepID=UPI003824948F
MNRDGASATLSTLLDSLHTSAAKVVFPEQDTVLPHRVLPLQAERLAGKLLEKGVRRGDVVGLLMPTTPEFLPAFFSVTCAGAAVSILPLPPVVLDPAAAARHLAPMVDTARMRHLVVHGTGRAIGEHLAKTHPELCLVDASATLADATGTGTTAVQPSAGGAPPRPQDLALVQFTSGSTSRPRGVMHTHRGLLAGVSAINERIRGTSADVLVQWIPLFHDMGLVSLLCSLHAHADAHLFSPMAFIRKPAELVEHIARHRGTVTTSPNFAYDKIATLSDGMSSALTASDGLSQWRVAFNGGEMVQARTVDAFLAAFGPLGVSAGTMYPSYGLAEAVLAVCLPQPGATPRRVHVDRDTLIPGQQVFFVDPPDSGLALVGAGTPITGIEVRITAPDGITGLGQGRLGEICIRGIPVTPGYLHQPEATGTVLKHGWLHTGDLGFLHHGELFVAGRLKDMIVVQGRNYFPDDVEELVRDLSGIYRQRVVAIADPDTEHIVVVAESTARPGTAQHEQLLRTIEGTVTTELGLSAVRVYLVAPRTLPKTTSGKWQRSRVRELLAPPAQAEDSPER